MIRIKYFADELRRSARQHLLTRWALKMNTAMSGPNPRKRHHSFDENVNEPAKLLEGEAVEVEEEYPTDENEPVQQIEKPDPSDSSAFEEE